MKLAIAAMFLSLALATPGCGRDEIGEECDKPGDSKECVDGAMCGKDTNGATVCLKTCAADTDCPAERACNGIEGTNIKGCRLKTTK